MHIQMSDVRYFIEVAQTKNISRAAERLGITQPSLSTAVRRLEGQLNVVLLVRSKSGVRLSDAGKIFHLKCKELVAKWEELEKDLSASLDEPAGRYVIGCHPSVAQYTVVESIGTLIDQYPKLEFELAHDISRKITERVISFEADFGITVNPVRHPDLVMKKIAEDDFTVWSGREGVLITDPQRPRTLIYDPSLLQSQHILKQVKGLDTDHFRSIESSSLEVIAAMTANHCGFGLLPARVAARYGLHLATTKKDKDFHYKDEIFLIYRADQPKSRSRQLIAAALVQNPDSQ